MNNLKSKSIHLHYYALLRENRGGEVDEETIQTSANTAHDLYEELQKRYNFHLPDGSLKVAINDAIASWQTELKNGDHVVFIPPVSGG